MCDRTQQAHNQALLGTHKKSLLYIRHKIQIYLLSFFATNIALRAQIAYGCFDESRTPQRFHKNNLNWIQARTTIVNENNFPIPVQRIVSEIMEPKTNFSNALYLDSAPEFSFFRRKVKFANAARQQTQSLGSVLIRWLKIWPKVN
jgi:hypothetical protein